MNIMVSAAELYYMHWSERQPRGPWNSWEAAELCVAENYHCTSPWTRHPHRETWWWQHHAVRMLFFSRDKDLRLGRRFTFQQDNEPNHAARTTIEWFRSKHIHVLEWSSQSPDLNQLENLWQDLKIAVHRHFPSNQTTFELFCKEEWANISASICAWLVETYPKRLAAVISAKDGSTKYWPKGMNTFAHHTFLFFICKKCF